MTPSLHRYWIRTLVPAAIVTGLLGGCGKQPSTRGRADNYAAQSDAATQGVPANDTRRAELLRKIRAADPEQRTIQRALLNENNELGLILTRQTNLDEVPKLMRAVLAELDRAFPGKDHVAVAYAPTEPPRPIGTARLDARTRDMTYTPAHSR